MKCTCDRAANGKKRWVLWPTCLFLSVLWAENALAQTQGKASTSAKSRALTPEQSERLKERDQLEKQISKLRSEGKLADALAAAERKLALEREVLGEASEEAIVSLGLIGDIQENRDNWPAAISIRREIVMLRTRALGKAHWKVTDARLDVEEAEREAARTRQQRLKRDEAFRRTVEASRLEQAGKFREALPLVEQIQKLVAEVSGEGSRDYAAALHNHAQVLEMLGDYAAARLLSEQALAIHKAILGANHPRYATNLDRLAILVAKQGDYATAESLMKEAMVIWKQALGERSAEYAGTLANLAYVLQLRGDYAAARSLQQRAVEIIQQALGERNSYFATCLNNLGLLLEAQGDYAGAKLYLERALAIRKAALGERHTEYANSLKNLAGLRQLQGDYAAAKPLLEQAIAIYKDALGERHVAYAGALKSLATLFENEGNYTAAKPLYEQTLAIRERALGEKHPDRAIGLNDLGMLLYKQGDYNRARPFVERALAVNKAVLGERHSSSVTILGNLALLLRAQRDYAGAATLLKQAVEFAQENLRLAASAQSERQQLAMARQLSGYLSAYVSLAPAAKTPPETVYRLVFAAKGAVFERQSRLRLEQRLRADPNPETTLRLGEYQQTVNRLASLAAARPDPKQAPNYQKTIAELTHRRDELEAELSRRDAGFRNVRVEATATPEQLAATLPESACFVDLIRFNHRPDREAGKPQPPDEPRYAAFVVHRGRSIERIDLGPAAPIDQALSDFRDRIQREGDTDPPGQTLAKLVWAPVEHHLSGSTLVVVAPDGDLNFLPWAALSDPRSPGHYLIERCALATIGSGRALLTALHRPAPAGSPTLLAAGAIDYDHGDLGAPQPAPSLAAASPTPVLASRGVRAPATAARYTPLPATGTEAAAAAAAFAHAGNGRADVLAGAQATKNAVSRLLPGHRYLHLATHGYFAPPSVKSAANPDPTSLTVETAGRLSGSEIDGFYPGLLSGLAWAGVNKPPIDPATGLLDVSAGVMTAEEVGSLDLAGCEVAVLSACETGLGRTAGGEGVLGLQRAFHEAGCRTVIASLWKVDDAATAALMSQFYKHLFDEKLSAIDAMRKAQLEMLEGTLPLGGTPRGISAPQPADPKASRTGKRVHPRCWAAWTVSGPPKSCSDRASSGDVSR